MFKKISFRDNWQNRDQATFHFNFGPSIKDNLDPLRESENLKEEKEIYVI